MKYYAGDKLKCMDGTDRVANTGEIVTVVKESCGLVFYKKDNGNESIWYSDVSPYDFQLYKEPSVKNPSVKEERMKKQFINVEKYATDFNIPLAQAHEEIQTWLFE